MRNENTNTADSIPTVGNYPNNPEQPVYRGQREQRIAQNMGAKQSQPYANGNGNDRGNKSIKSSSKKQGSGFAVTALVLGIIALVTCWIPIVNNLSFILGGIGLVFGIVAIVKKQGGLGIAGTICCALACVGTLSVQSALGTAIDEVTKDNVKPSAVATNSSQPQSGPSSSSSSTSGDSSSTDAAQYKIGDVIALDGLEITVKSVERNWSKGYSKPSNGKEFVKVTVSYANNTKEKQSYNTFDWELQDSDGDINSTAFATPDDSLGSGGLSVGGKKTGSIVFEVPKGDANLTLHYRSSFLSSNTVEIKL